MPEGRARNWTMDIRQGSDDGQPDLDAMIAEVAAAIAAAFQADRGEIEAAAARGETGYIQVRRSTVDASEKEAKSWEEIAPLMAAQANELREKVASLGLTPEEADLLTEAELWLQRFRRGGAGSQEA